jgi:hypothetical protein
MGLPSDLFPSCFLIKISYAFLISPMHAACSTPWYWKECAYDDDDDTEEKIGGRSVLK